ncbi:MAG TPA: NAD(P)H-hydrate dehydratase, partial [Candidatus Limnocylindrales bacterium]|nr:NAD(P)H-hydrate dehydratase [Candidatus Limnocylindrales bacterium]
DAEVNEKYIEKTSFPVQRLLTAKDLDCVRTELNSADLLVDALLGIGIERAVEGLLADLIRSINDSNVPVLSVDIPSGVDADTGLVLGCAVQAKWTVTFAFPKKGLLLHPGASYAGEIIVGEINIPSFLVENEPINLLTASYVRGLFPQRSIDAHKGSMGRVLVVAGSPGMSGAAVMAAEAALRGGAGLVYLAAPKSLCPALEAKLIEVITVALPETRPGIIAPEAAEQILQKAGLCQVLAVGPGLNPGSATTTLLESLIASCPVPMVIDAGALEAIADKMHLLQTAKHLPVLTPHAGEMARLVGTGVVQVQQNRLEIALKCARQWNSILLLKGANTIIALPDGRAYINPTGGPALSTAGSGDLLTGLVASFIAQGLLPAAAAAAGAYIHGLSGDLVPEERGHMARDILLHFKQAFQYVAFESAYTNNATPYLHRIRPVA